MSKSIKRPAGRHRAIPATKAKAVPADIRLALQRAVESVDGTYDPNHWSFDQSSLLVWVANRLSRTEGGFDRIAFTPECRYIWVERGQSAEEALAAFVGTTTLSRMEIEWLLSDEIRHPKGEWLLEVVGDLGWLCSRQSRWGKRRYFAVTPDRQFREVLSTSIEDAAPVLTELATEARSASVPVAPRSSAQASVEPGTEAGAGSAVDVLDVVEDDQPAAA